MEIESIFGFIFTVSLSSSIISISLFENLLS